MKIRMLLVVSLLAALAACATSGVDTSYGDTTDFSQYRTWNWLPGGGEGPTGVDPAMDRRIRAAIGRALKDRGFDPAAEAPDFLVSYAIETDPHARRGGGYYQRTRGARRSVPGGEITPETTMTLFFTDVGEKQLLWKGTAGGVVADPKSEDTNVTKSIHRILAEYPPKE